jgi:hypothetical protein
MCHSSNGVNFGDKVNLKIIYQFSRDSVQVKVNKLKIKDALLQPSCALPTFKNNWKGQVAGDCT